MEYTHTVMRAYRVATWPFVKRSEIPVTRTKRGYRSSLGITYSARTGLPVSPSPNRSCCIELDTLKPVRST